jgi:diacylglycerol kinase (ATP)
MTSISDRLMLIVNPVAGGGKAIDMLPEVDSILTALGASFDVRITEKKSQATEIARQAANVGYKRIIALGGDGTVNEVATGLLGKETALGVIPAGKGNDFFESLSIKTGLKQICGAAASGPIKNFDAGMLNGQPFFNSVGLGFDTVFAQETNLSRAGKYSYLKAIYRAWKNYASYNVDLRIDNLPVKQAISMIAANIGQSTGGGLLIAPNAIVNDGKFDVCIVHKVKRSRILSLLPKIAKGDHTRLPEVRMYRCRQLEISSEQPLPILYEGEVFDNPNGHITIKAHPDKLKVAVGFAEKDES